MDIAYSQLGVHETAGPGATPEIKRYFASLGRDDVISDEVSWCAAYVGWCAKEAGYDLSMIKPSEALLARSYLKAGVAIAEPRVGCLVVFSRDQAGPHAGHVGWVVGWTATHIMVLGGNQANSVSISAYPRADVLGFRWFGDVATPGDLAAAGSRIALASRQQVADGARVLAAQPVQALPGKLPGLGDIAAKAGEVQSATDTLLQFAAFSWKQLPWVALILTLYWIARMAWNGVLIGRFRAEDHNTGKTAAPAALPAPGGT